ncbi:MAG: DUF1579 domain-containing protein [Planctomycetes bacterium]|nr:DUF1579 domain-containing protein [Planctomycetota bacterium]MBI3834798.1 DUF1579 domain-containing protein [Planctomycetota bacterium]
MNTEPQDEHKWLQKFVGQWSYESEAVMGPGKPPEKFKGNETVRSLGGHWVIFEGVGDMPGSGTATCIMTLGYDPTKKAFVGTFIASVTNLLWVYEGSLDPAGKVLTLNAEGPNFCPDGSMKSDGKLTKYKDVLEFRSDDHRVMTSQALGDDGKWVQFMTANYRKKK